MKHLLLLVAVALSPGLRADQYSLITPTIITIQDNVERIILDYSTSDELGLNQMRAPVGWTEPIVALGYELRGIVIGGTLGLEFKDETVTFEQNEGFIIPINTQVRIYNAGEDPLHLVEVLRPGHKEALVKQYGSFE